jgi:hypothetical protein
LSLGREKLFYVMVVYNDLLDEGEPPHLWSPPSYENDVIYNRYANYYLLESDFALEGLMSQDEKLKT